MYDHIWLISPGGQGRSRLKRVPFADPVKMAIGRGLHESKAAMSRFDVRPYKGLHHLQIPLPSIAIKKAMPIKDESLDQLQQQHSISPPPIIMGGSKEPLKPLSSDRCSVRNRKSHQNRFA
jgi:hypothetical protein